MTHLEDLEDYHLSADAVARIRRGDVDGIGLYQTGGLEGADLFGTHGEVFSSRNCPTNVAVSRGWERAGVR